MFETLAHAQTFGKHSDKHGSNRRRCGRRPPSTAACFLPWSIPSQRFSSSGPFPAMSARRKAALGLRRDLSGWSRDLAAAATGFSSFAFWRVVRARARKSRVWIAVALVVASGVAFTLAFTFAFLGGFTNGYDVAIAVAVAFAVAVASAGAVAGASAFGGVVAYAWRFRFC
jgi:hypothetical protein